MFSHSHFPENIKKFMILEAIVHADMLSVYTSKKKYKKNKT